MFLVAFLALLVCVVGLVRPYRFLGLARKHYGLGIAAAFVAMMLTVEPTPHSGGRSNAKQEASSSGAHDAIVAKAKAALEGLTDYTRKEYPDTYKRVGPATFKRLGEFERGAIYAAAESDRCDKVSYSGASDRSKANAALFFVDCDNENRFMISQAQAEQALQRFGKRALHEVNLAESCTTSTVALCSATSAQRAMSEAEAATICDMIVERALVSGDADTDWSWNYSLGKGNTVRVVRGFTSTNGFGAKLKSRYFCDLDASTKEPTRLVIETPYGTEKLI